MLQRLPKLQGVSEIARAVVIPAAARGTYVKSAGLKRPSGAQKRLKLDF
jgi:hypothetical protein